MTDRRGFFRSVGGMVAGDARPAREAGPPPATVGGELPLVPMADPRRLAAQVRRVLAAADSLGSGRSTDDRRDLEAALAVAGTGDAAAVAGIQRALDRSCLADVHINPEMRVKVARGPGRPVLTQRGWRAFLVKVRNESGTTAALRAAPAHAREYPHDWLEVRMFDDAPLSPTLSGLDVEYRIVRLYSHAAGPREASLIFDVGQGTQDIGFRNELPMLFDCLAAR